MSHWLDYLPQIILAQALGVGLAWGVEALSWKWRPVDGFSASNLVTDCLRVIGLFALFLLLIFGMSFPAFFAPPLLWLLLVAWVQKRQLNVVYSNAFCGALIQFGCFGLLIFGGGFLAALFWFLIPGLFMVVWLASAALTYALLSLFRPTIHGAWSSLRQITRENPFIK